MTGSEETRQIISFGYQPAGMGPLATPQRLRDTAISAEGLGYDALSVTDHVVLPIKMESVYPYSSTGLGMGALEHDWYDPIALLGYWAGITSRVRLQTSVLVLPYRNPVITAKMLSSLDALSGGRLEIGVGTGWMEEEFEFLHSPDFRRRGKVTDEYIGVFRTLWDDPFPSFDGEFYQISDLVMYPKPAARRHLPILVGGTTKPALRRAARLGDGWQPLKTTAEAVGAGLATIHEEADRAGRRLPGDFQVSVRFGMRVSPNVTARREHEEPDRVFVGSPDEVALQVQAYLDAGATAFMLDTRTCSVAEIGETVELFAREVMPRFRPPSSSQTPTSSR